MPRLLFFVGVDLGGRELAGWNSSMEEDIQFSVGPALHLG